MKIRLLSLIALLLCVTTSFSQATFTENDIEYEITGVNTVKIIAVGPAVSGDVIIEPTVTSSGNEFNVTAIGKDAFAEKDLDSVAIPDGVTTIGESAFAGNLLTSVEIPNSVTTIGESAFEGNVRLAEVSLGNNLETIGDRAFAENDLRSIDIPNSVRSIGNFSFGDNRLAEVTLGTRVETIDDSAFENNDLVSVTIPDSVETIGNFAFSENPLEMVIAEGNEPATICEDTFGDRSDIALFIPLGDTIAAAYEYKDWEDFKSVNAFTIEGITYKITSEDTVEIIDYTEDATTTAVSIPNDVTNLGITYSVTTIGNFAFEGNALESVTIPDSVKIIGEEAFADNALESVTIPDSVETIGDSAFAENPLEMVIAEGTEPATIVEDTFGNDRITIALFIPVGDEIAQEYINKGWIGFKSVNEFTIDYITYKITSEDDSEDDSVEIIDYTGESKVVSIPNTVTNLDKRYDVTSIGHRAFSENALESVTIPDSVTFIGFLAFYGNALEKVTIPGSVKTIDEGAFWNNALVSVSIPDSVEAIDQNTFRNNALESVTIPDSVETIGEDAFNGNPLETVIAEGSTPATIVEDTFGDRSDIGLIIPLDDAIAQEYINKGWIDFKLVNGFTIDGITYKITSEKSVEIIDYTEEDSTVVSIPNTVTITNNLDKTYDVTSIGRDAFRNNALTSVTIGNNVKTIGRDAFNNNILTSVTIGNNVKTIGFHAFNNNILTSIEIPDSVETIGDGAFAFNELVSVTIGNKLETIDQNVFKDNKLTSVSIPNTVTTIGEGAFENNALESVTLGNRVETIGEDAFEDNALTSVSIPGSVNIIGEDAFKDNPLATVIAEGTEPATIFEDTFGNRGNITLSIPLGSAEDYEADGWDGFGTVTSDNALASKYNKTLAIDAMVINAKDVQLLIKDDLMSIVSPEATPLKSYTIYGLSGNLLLSGRQDSVSLAELPQGLYIAVLTFDNGLMINKKFIK